MDWSFSAQTLLDQLPSDVQESALAGLSRLEADIKPDRPLPDELKLVGLGSTGSVYAYHVLPDWVLAIRKRDDAFTVIDVARTEQLDFLRAQSRRHHELQG